MPIVVDHRKAADRFQLEPQPASPEGPQAGDPADNLLVAQLRPGK